MTVNPNSPINPIAPPQQKSSGCLKYGLIGCVIVLAIVAIVAAAIMAVAFGAIKSTDAYKEAQHRAVTDPRVLAALGAPVEAGFFVTGKISVVNRTGTAIMNFPISGSRQKASVRAEATLDAEGWHYSVLRVEPQHGPPIDLLPAQ
jgi:Cytochrome oxidase complex assembly protein 1